MGNHRSKLLKIVHFLPIEKIILKPVRKEMFIKLAGLSLAVCVLTSCTAGFRPQLTDYQGEDAARIRVATEGNTALQFYEKQNKCYKKVLERRITSGFALMGVPVTGGKSLGMPPSSDVKGIFINEFKIKPGQFVTVIHYWTESGYYQNTERLTTEDFIPQAGHDYDIIVEGSQYSGDSVRVKDLDPGAKIVKWSGVKLCPSSIFD
ncbi:hypothetical protein ACQK5W_12600 [Pantoea sp. FN060301]|uniref:hypothetical protein n=1 Tax=Pantoea sp. FN060301 TaxID=3420380 RepID=UPI003D16250C